MVEDGKSIVNETGKKLFVLKGLRDEKPQIIMVVKRPRNVEASLSYILNQIPDNILVKYLKARFNINKVT